VDWFPDGAAAAKRGWSWLWMSSSLLADARKGCGRVAPLTGPCALGYDALTAFGEEEEGMLMIRSCG
jgi:hypothetical protein